MGRNDIGALQIVWFKRDLRLRDHRALSRAAQHGPLLPLYIVDAELWHQPDSSARQWAFARESLQQLDARSERHQDADGAL